MPVEVHEVENSAKLLVPAIFSHANGSVLSFLDEFGAVESLAEVHNEPHSLNGMTRVHVAAVHAINE